MHSVVEEGMGRVGCLSSAFLQPRQLRPSESGSTLRRAAPAASAGILLLES